MDPYSVLFEKATAYTHDAIVSLYVTRLHYETDAEDALKTLRAMAAELKSLRDALRLVGSAHPSCIKTDMYYFPLSICSDLKKKIHSLDLDVPHDLLVPERGGSLDVESFCTLMHSEK